ncbi:MAG: type I DNA topoisomerase [Candidatus Nanosynbacter sp.]|nr:type I DNA topoisomerase [Candidatus Nanosynbacter sp.]
MSKNLVIVESPAKAKTIEKYLGSDFKVLASVGHIRKDTKVDVHDNFAVTYEIDPDHKHIIAELKKEAKAAEAIWLATDEDREGESISWHLLEVLKLPKNTHRITFHEITKSALQAAIAKPRTVDMDMVSSQQARQTLDMLVGYDLSDIVRKKVPGAKSAGRVQSPALRLIVEKEREIEKFASKSTFKVAGKFSNQNANVTDPESSEIFEANLEKSTLKDADEVKSLFNSLAPAVFSVANIEQTEGTKANPVPFTTAALQIEANSRLGYSAKTTMSAAQGLYQAGLITYHRTDSLNLSSEAIAAISNYIKQAFGENYVQVRRFHTKDASAQEAHEAIRPTNIAQEVAGKNDYEKKLYQLIRTRTLATQMKNAVVAKTTVDITPSTDPELHFTAKGEVVIFDGFLRIYGKNKDTLLPQLNVGDQLNVHNLIAKQTYSKPPARYTEGSLVKKLEELGIGRPSTYASIINAIQVRNYVTKGESEGTERNLQEIILHGHHSVLDQDAAPNSISEDTVKEKTGASKGKLLPTPVGELVSDFLCENFENIVDYDFTAGIEEQLDKIAEHKLTRLKMLRDFYTPFAETVGASAMANRYNSATELGIDPKTNKKVYAKIGRNGGFIQLGENEKEAGEKPIFAPLPAGKTVKTVTLELALKQLELPQLPRLVGTAPDGAELIAANGPFGPYLKAGNYNIPLSRTNKAESPYTISFDLANELYQKKKSSIIADWGEVKIINGPFGPYIKGPAIKPASGKGRPRPNNIKIPADIDPKSLTLEKATELLNSKTTTTTTKTVSKSTKAAKTTAKTKKSTKSATKSSKTVKSASKTTKARKATK